VPVFLKREITDQFPMLKKENLLHREYAKKMWRVCSQGVGEGLGAEAVHILQIVVAYNEGAAVQGGSAAAVGAVVECECHRTDGPERGWKGDLVLGGNKFVFPPQFGRLDGSYGHVLLNEGDGKLKYIGNRETD